MMLGAFANASAGLLLKKTVGLDIGGRYISFLLMSLLSYAFAFAFYALALREMPVYLAYIVMTGIATLFLMLYSHFFDGLRINGISLFGVSFILLGIFLLLKDIGHIK